MDQEAVIQVGGAGVVIVRILHVEDFGEDLEGQGVGWRRIGLLLDQVGPVQIVVRDEELHG